LSVAQREIRVVKPDEKKVSGEPKTCEKCGSITPEVKALVLDLRRRLNTVQDKFDDLCDLIKV
jgi:hypothetical protein